MRGCKMAKELNRVAMAVVYISNGMSWPVQIELDLPIKSAKACRETFAEVTAWLLKAGFRPDQSGGVNGPRNEVGQSQPAPAMPEKQAVEPAGPSSFPACPIHDVPMKLSKVQKKAGKTLYFCTKQDSAGYCQHRATVDSDGSESLWKVN